MAKDDFDAIPEEQYPHVLNSSVPAIYADGGVIDPPEDWKETQPTKPSPFEGLSKEEIDKWIRTRVPPRDKSKDTNPKDAVGVAKAPLSVIPSQVLMEVGLAMMEGARKYGAANYRVAGVRSSVYYDATMRHLIAWQEGQDTDPDSGLSHITKAITSLVVLRDAMMNDMLNDDRPPKAKNWDQKLIQFNDAAKKLLDRYPDGKIPYTEANKNDPR